MGAKAAFNAGAYVLRVYDELASDAGTPRLAIDLREFTRSEITRESDYATFIAVFRAPMDADEAKFEEQLWSQLTKLNRIDADKFDWDPSVRSDPADPQFSFSFAGQALYVIGLHANSSRHARRFPWPTLVFNPHEQFERLRNDGKWKRMQETIRERDVQLQGSVNPMLSDFGQSSEARQYSGRAVEGNWQPPFTAAKSKAADSAPAGRCPFAH
ncbi:MAG: YqcI/YcgG family protein [Verrucomicrobiota bacterium]|nr:YqcI/YcgG family protein [Verrucomicrobiota bacterium]